jgi:uncharacterized protein (DUF111 family)
MIFPNELEGRLLFVQIDNVSGELLGEALTRLCSAGATNVQLLSTLTKKGRPGQLLLVDVRQDKLNSVEEALLAELGVTGWHRLTTQHIYVSTEIINRELTVLTPVGVMYEQVVGKRLANSPGSVTPEYSSCVALRERLHIECGVRVPLRELIRLVGGVLNNEGMTSIDLRSQQDGNKTGEPDG